MIRISLALALVAAALAAPAARGADPAAEVAARAAERGADAAPLVAPVREAERRGLPARVVADKVLEGLAKGVAPPRDRDAALADLASALGAGVDRASLEALVGAARSKSGTDGAVAAARVLSALGRRGVAVSDALPLGRAVAANPRSAADVVPAFDEWRAEGGRDPRAFLAGAERRVAEGRAVGRADRVDTDRGARDAGRDERSRMGGDAGRRGHRP